MNIITVKYARVLKNESLKENEISEYLYGKLLFIKSLETYKKSSLVTVLIHIETVETIVIQYQY